ncbi:MAG: hypothetical protein NTV89_09605 [Proteobacteria bacterium]|nr:hypothetical protein [Pseudomonadota bacterium]
MGGFAEGAEGIFGKKVKAFLNKEHPASRSLQGFSVLSPLVVIFVFFWQEKIRNTNIEALNKLKIKMFQTSKHPSIFHQSRFKFSPLVI